MSHFVVLVQTPTADLDQLHTALAPFHEFECTGVDDEYVIDQDITNETLKEHHESKEYRDKDFIDFCREWHGAQAVEQGCSPDLAGDHKYGYVQTMDRRFKVVRRTNPDAKWDWYKVGGRWSDMLTRKDGTKTDVASKAAVVLAAGKDKAAAENEADKLWLHSRSLLPEGAEWPRPFRELVADGRSRDEQKALYYAQPGIAEIKSDPVICEHFGSFMSEPIFDLACNREDYRELAGLQTIKGRAILTPDHGWEEHGTMGWFGISSGETMTDLEWYRHLWKRINEAPNDSHLWVVDCHI